MIGIIDVAAFLCDSIFAFLYLKTARRDTEGSAFRRLAAIPFLLVTIVFYPIGFSPLLANNWIRFFCRAALYVCYLSAAGGVPFRLSLYGAVLCTAVFTISHNALLTPITRPVLMLDVSLTPYPAVDALLCVVAVCGFKTLCYAFVYRTIPLSNVKQVERSQVVLLATVVIASLYVKGVQVALADNDSDGLGELSLYFVMFQIAMLLCIVLFEQYHRTSIENTAHRLQTVTAQALLERIQAKQEQDEEIRRLRHDLKNHMLTLRHLVQDNRPADAVQYVDGFLGEIRKDGELHLHTGNRLLDGLMSDKLNAAVLNGIAVNVVLDFRAADFIDGFDLCVIMGNAIDNAIEACAKIPEGCARYIDVRGGPSANCLLLHITNSIKGAPPASAGLPLTTKQDQQNHGFGLGNVKRTLAKYHGTLSVECDAENFIFTALIPIPG